MRLKLELIPELSAPPSAVTRHHVQAMIYSYLQGTPYEELHDRPGFKFFNFSNLFPGLEIRRGIKKSLIISSPDEGFIETLHEKLLPVERLYLGKIPFRVEGIKVFKLLPRDAFITDTPVVVLSRRGRGFFTFYQEGDINYFLYALTQNALRKYRQFTGEEFELHKPLFKRMIPYSRKKGWMDVYVKVTFDGREKTIVGSLWKRMEFELNKDTREFYAFLMDAGLGILNSLGFGFVNPVRETKHPMKNARHRSSSP